jgi:hypothetical protein
MPSEYPQKREASFLLAYGLQPQVPFVGGNTIWALTHETVAFAYPAFR